MANFAKGLTAMGNRTSQRQCHSSRPDADRPHRAIAGQFAKAQNKTVEQVREEPLVKSGLRRIGQPEDVAEMALFLASAKGRHIQGTRSRSMAGKRRGIIEHLSSRDAAKRRTRND